MLNKLRELRNSHQITQELLAEQVGVSRQTIISIEAGRYNPSILLAYKIARVFNLPIENVFLCEEEIQKGDVQ